MGLLGRILLALGGAGLGVLSLIHGDFIQNLIQAPADLPARTLLAYAVNGVLIGASVALLLPRFTRLAAAVLAVFWLAAALTHIPVLLEAKDAGPWTGACEALALFGAALVAHGRWALIGRLLFGATLPMFGYLHFAFIDYVASVIPAWIAIGPLTQVMWAQITGVAHIAAGLSLMSGVFARLAATLLGVMFAGFVALVHIPRVAADFHNRNEWNSLLVAVALAGAAWVIAASLPRRALAPPLGARDASGP